MTWDLKRYSIPGGEGMKVRGSLLTSGRVKWQNDMNEVMQASFLFFPFLFIPGQHSTDSAIFKVENTLKDTSEGVSLE